jgi:hypothetical protein
MSTIPSLTPLTPIGTEEAYVTDGLTNKRVTLNAIAALGTQTDAEIRAAVAAATDSNVYDDAAVTKLGGIEALADVTDATNVAAAGAVMDSDYNANTILAADTDDTPLPLTIAEQTVVGRITGGSITALTATQLRTLINVEDGADVTDATNVAAAGALLTSGGTMSGTLSLADNIVSRPVLEDYAIQGSAIGNVGATRTFDCAVANYFTATVDQASTFTFSNPPATGDAGGFRLVLTNGGAFAITFPAAVDWDGGTAPTLTAAGVDIMDFTTSDAGTIWYGTVVGLDMK